MKTHNHGLRNAIVTPFIPLITAAMDFMKNDSPGRSFSTFMFGLIVVLSWHGGHNNVVRMSATTIEVWNVYWRWWIKRKVELNDLRKVFVDGGSRSGPVSFKCTLTDGTTFEFRSGLIGESGAKKIAGELEERGIEVETYRL